ncbi:outer membrane protein assembly factor BamA [Paraburkholderia azotifigens]|uniref:outer membrane protein assembly factor BamA n=1 Tax=Paraburkholderia azotifigens TaxID=2057004 RepID=UPI0031802AD9
MKRDLQRLVFTAIAACLTVVESPQALANNPVVKEIRIEGLRHLQPDRFLPSLPLKPGDTLSDDIASKCLNAMYNTGLIADATVDINGDVAVFHVVEKPTIAQLEFSGLHEFDKDKLSLVFKDVGIAPGTLLDKAQLNKAVQRLRDLYLGRGFHAVKVEPTVTPLDRDRVSVLVTLNEGPVAKIRHIGFFGNEHFKDRTLLNEIALRPSEWSSWYTKNDVFAKHTLAVDLERIRHFYLDRGYVDFSIDSVQTSMTPDGTSVDLTLTIHEGMPYTVGEVQLAGDLLARETDIRSLIRLHPGETYSASKLTASVEAISDLLGRYGYGFADVRPVPRLNRERQTLDITLAINPGARLYVRRVNIKGNLRTRDEVIRREMLQLESSWYDKDRVDRSRDRIRRLGLFSSVEVNTVPVGGTPDQIDIDVTVAEQKTGAVRLSAGSSSSDKFFVSAGVSEANLLGSGNAFNFQLDTSAANRTFSVSLYEPYITPEGISGSTDAYYRKSQFKSKAKNKDVDITSYGGHVKFGFPVLEDDKVFLGTGIEKETYKATGAPRIYKEYIGRVGEAPVNVPVTLEWLHDRRDNALIPGDGYLVQANAEYGAPLGASCYYRTDLLGQYYYSVAKGLVLSANIRLGYGQGLGDTPLPIGKRYSAGGIGSVRGYKAGSLGPKDSDTGDSIGGTMIVVGNLEMSFPIPGSGWDRTLRVFSFVDAGNVWGEDGIVGSSDLRYSCGAGLEWMSPIGPLKLSLAMPLVQHEGDDYEKFQFQIGTSF